MYKYSQAMASRKENIQTGLTIMINNLRRYWILLLFMVPGFIIAIINNYLPMYGILLAFKKIDYKLGIFESPFAGFDNFRFLFVTEDAWRITRNTLLFNLVFIFLGLVINVIIAISMNEIRNKIMGRIYQTIIIMPYFLSMVVIGYLVYAFLDPTLGFLNMSVFPMLGINEISWYTESKHWIIILPIVNFWIYSGINSIIYLASITGIDSEIYEAAIVDGATKKQQIFHITMPLLLPVIIIMTLLSLGNIFKANFGLFYQVPLNSGALYSVTDVIDTYVYRALTKMSDIGMSAAASLYQSLVGFALVMGANMFIRKIDKSSALF